MGYLIHLGIMDNGVLLTFFTCISVGIFGDSNEEEGTYTALHLSIFKLELTTSIGWR